mmetsp:Transcript_36890/g.66338  ORF Transcript_36890/g.66338 Transcript_36890/m.66338 type:complete len:202 (+) Transcript_36890:153-758(+)
MAKKTVEITAIAIILEAAHIRKEELASKTPFILGGLIFLTGSTTATSFEFEATTTTGAGVGATTEADDGSLLALLPNVPAKNDRGTNFVGDTVPPIVGELDTGAIVIGAPVGDTVIGATEGDSVGLRVGLNRSSSLNPNSETGANVGGFMSGTGFGVGSGVSTRLTKQVMDLARLKLPLPEHTTRSESREALMQSSPLTVP